MATETLDPAQSFMAEITDRFKPLHDITARGTSSVQQFYCGATVFLTGGSGFLGKQLIEKLLRATKVSKIYVLLRCKKGKSVQQRLLEMLTDPLYDTLREQQPGFVDKIVAMAGDVSELKLGMSFVYVSTAYTHASADRVDDTVQEKFYPSPLSPETMVGIAETMEDEIINDITTSSGHYERTNARLVRHILFIWRQWNTLEHVLGNEAIKYVTPKAVGYGFVWYTYNRLLFWLYTWLLHLIPAYIIDVIAVTFGYKMR
ncbi:unnamed protein product [Spodoptera littoralis]|uniref:Fatty acyl-CoA reductase n=1 Tax=Spodoptera littoralis TaxID=7109 RepID=A0A9P0HWL7_SPOLI|nr:unnamed protein product [Spodoptera littoralis]CAH1636738.1 unnamed protein product [Spodoptera littoralis]